MEKIFKFLEFIYIEIKYVFKTGQNIFTSPESSAVTRKKK
jgi:hypothetical protein